MKPESEASGTALGAIWDAVWGDASPAERMRMLRIAFRLAIVFHIAWACGALSAFGLGGFAWAEDVEKKSKETDAVHAALLLPINTRLDELTKESKETQALVRRLLVGQLANQIRDLHRIRCLTPDQATRMRLEYDIDEAQVDYRHLTNERYPLVPCKDL